MGSTVVFVPRRGLARIRLEMQRPEIESIVFAMC